MPPPLAAIANAGRHGVEATIMNVIAHSSARRRVSPNSSGMTNTARVTRTMPIE